MNGGRECWSKLTNETWKDHMRKPHTPGPWAYQEESDAYTHIVRAGDRFLCQLSQDTSGESEANARLMAAAPDLLEALRMMVRGLEWRIENHPQCIDPSDYEALSAARLAILQATEPG